MASNVVFQRFDRSNPTPSHFSIPEAFGTPDFVNNLGTHYQCIECKSQLIPTVYQLICGHRICELCLEYIKNSSNPTCPGTDPECREVNVTEGTYFPDFSINKELGREKVNCLNKSYGCHEQFPLSKAAAHMKTCGYFLKKCKFADRGCSAEVLTKDLDEHQNCCEFDVFLKCSFCEQHVLKTDMDNGHGLECKQIHLQCPLFGIGCKFVGESKAELEKHSITENIPHMLLIKNLIDVTQTKLTKEIEENRHLATEITKTDQEMLKSIIAFNKEVKSKMQLFQDYAVNMCGGKITELFHEIELLQLQVNAMKNNPQTPLPIPDDIADEMKTLSISIEAQDDKINQSKSPTEAESSDGNFTWQINDYNKHKRNAKLGNPASIVSNPFLTSPAGYKLCLRLYPNGDGVGINTHISLYIVIMRGEYDRHLPWPFPLKVTFSIMDQTDNHKDISRKFRPDPNSISFKQPGNERPNLPSGCPQFVLQSTAETDSYVQNDTMKIRAQVAAY